MPLRAYGIAAAVASNILFSLLFFYGSLMRPMQGVDIFAWRMFASLPAIALLITLGRGWGKVRNFLRAQGGDWRRWLLIILPTPIMAGQLCLFMWGPTAGRGVDIAIGYFLFPLAMAAGGVWVFGERMNAVQKAAIALAAAGVALEIVKNGGFSWVSLIIFTTYPIYYLLRRRMGVPPLIGLFIDMLLLFPFICVYLFAFSPSLAQIAADPSLVVWIVVLGLHGALAMQLNLAANQYLPVVLFGILSYVEPALLFVIAVAFLGEPLTAGSLLSYGLIWAGIALVIRHNLRLLRQARRANAAG